MTGTGAKEEWLLSIVNHCVGADSGRFIYRKLAEHERILDELAPTLRDRFAMAALPYVGEASKYDFAEEIADACYRMADAMLAARKPKQEDDK